MEELSIAPRPGEPLAAWFAAPQPEGGLRSQRFECASHGDLVSGRCWWPAGAANGLALAVHELGRDKQDPALTAAAAVWGAAGIATAAIDLPLHGERRNAKLSPRAVAARVESHPDHALWRGLVAQAVRDLARALDALATRGALPPVACVAFGDAAPIAAAFAQLDSRVREVAAIGAPRALPAAGLGPAKALAWLARPDDLSLVH
jgi:hypothetical protein